MIQSLKTSIHISQLVGKCQMAGINSDVDIEKQAADIDYLRWTSQRGRVLWALWTHRSASQCIGLRCRYWHVGFDDFLPCRFEHERRDQSVQKCFEFNDREPQSNAWLELVVSNAQIMTTDSDLYARAGRKRQGVCKQSWLIQNLLRQVVPPVGAGIYHQLEMTHRKKYRLLELPGILSPDKFVCVECLNGHMNKAPFLDGHRTLSFVNSSVPLMHRILGRYLVILCSHSDRRM